MLVLRGVARAGVRSPVRNVTRETGTLNEPEKLVRDCFDYLPHRVAEPGERYGLLAAKFDEEVAEVKAAAIGSAAFVEELGDLVEVCYALGGKDRVEQARVAKLERRGGFDRLLVMRLEDRTDK